MPNRRIAAVLAAVLFSAAVAGAELPMGEVVEFPHAGIALAIPQGHRMQTVNEPFDVMRAAAFEGNQPVQAVTLSALPVSQVALSAEVLADAMIASQTNNLAIRNLQVLNTATMKVAELDGAAKLLSYSFRGEETVAATVYFVRELDLPKMRMCYVLTVEAPASRKSDVLPALGEVVKTVGLIAVRHPVDLVASQLGPVVANPQGRFSVRLPLGWYASGGATGLSMAQTDYLLGGLPTVSAHVVYSVVEAGSVQERMDQCLEAAHRAAAARNLQVRLVSRQNVKLAGHDACQIVFEQSAKTQPASAPQSSPATSQAAASLPPSVLIVQRSFCLPAAEGKKADSFSLVLVCQGASPEAATATMDKIAEGFQLAQPGPGTAPATSSAPAGPLPPHEAAPQGTPAPQQPGG